MRSRLIRLALLAYPREVRARDRTLLADLAGELAEDHGTAREVLGLASGGLAARWRGVRLRRAVVPLVAAGALGLTGLAWTANAHGRVEEEVFTCAEQCLDAEDEVDARLRDGWVCAERRAPAAVSWRCTRD